VEIGEQTERLPDRQTGLMEPPAQAGAIVPMNDQPEERQEALPDQIRPGPTAASILQGLPEAIGLISLAEVQGLTTGLIIILTEAEVTEVSLHQAEAVATTETSPLQAEAVVPEAFLHPVEVQVAEAAPAAEALQEEIYNTNTLGVRHS